MRKIVIPGEVIVEGDKYLPGEGTERRGKNVVAIKYGLAEESAGLVKVIPLSGVYHARRGNVVIGSVENITMNGWVVDIGTAEGAFLPLSEVSGFVNKKAIDEVMNIGDLLVAKIFDINKRGIDLTIRSKGLGKIEEGIIMEVNSNKVPRIIGKEGSMISLIKQETGCEITVGQNGLIWIQGEKVENELLAKKAILFIVEKSFVEGLTEEVKKWLDKNKR
ncbi:KH domain-containing protein [Candidatus Pacearchaeota archaeon]|nr:KH domain-containing protein [Candidatus Pacearchaeota archaeon]